MKDSLKNLFIVGTPLQLLNAIEAAEHFNLKNNILLIIHRSLAANRMQMESIKKNYQWDEIIEIEYSKFSSSITKRIKLVRFFKKSKFKYIFFARLERISRLIIANVEKEKIFILDDGVMTISIYENNLIKNKINKYDFKELRYLFFGVKIKIKDKINLFTYFDLKPTNAIDIVKNELTFLKKKHLEGANLDDSCIYFIGQPLSKYIGDHDYIQSIQNLMAQTDKKIIYIPHRAESNEMKNIFKSMESQLFSVVDIGMPVELYFLEKKIYPFRIISYCSTALITLKIIYTECEIYFVPIDLSNDINNTLKNIYKIFDNEGLGRLIIQNNQGPDVSGICSSNRTLN